MGEPIVIISNVPVAGWCRGTLQGCTGWWHNSPHFRRSTTCTLERRFHTTCPLTEHGTSDQGYMRPAAATEQEQQDGQGNARDGTVALLVLGAASSSYTGPSPTVRGLDPSMSDTDAALQASPMSSPFCKLDTQPHQTLDHVMSQDCPSAMHELSFSRT